MTEIEVLQEISGHLDDIKQILFVVGSVIVGYLFYRAIARTKLF